MDDDYFEKVVNYYESTNHQFFIPWSRTIMYSGKDDKEIGIVKATDMKAAAHGWCFTKKFYWDLGGMNEKYFGYGSEDQDLWERARNVLGTVPFMDYELGHTYHNFHPKDSNFPLNEARNKLLHETMINPFGEIEKLKKSEQGGKEPYAYRHI